MAKSGLKHIDVGAELTKTEWESEESHELVHGTSFPSSPVERQLFYRDDEHKWYIYNGTEWVWLGGGSGGGMQVHGNEYHDPDFATEAALSSHAAAATGVHGVGAGYIAKSTVDGLDVAIHGPRHKWLGADAVNIKDSFMVLNPFYYKSWQDIMGFTASHTGTGSFTLGFHLGLLTTGATSGSRGCIYETNGIPVYTSTPVYSPRWSLSINQSLAPTSKVAWFGLLETPTAPAATQKHIAFKIAGVDVYASCGNGTNGNLEDTGVDIGQYTTLDLYFKMVYDAVTPKIEYYINGVLKKTFTTYLPTSWETAKATVYVSNSAAEESAFKIWPLRMYLGPD
jgi:hypothetical protein